MNRVAVAAALSVPRNPVLGFSFNTIIYDALSVPPKSISPAGMPGIYARLALVPRSTAASHKKPNFIGPMVMPLRQRAAASSSCNEGV